MAKKKGVLGSIGDAAKTARKVARGAVEGVVDVVEDVVEDALGLDLDSLAQLKPGPSAPDLPDYVDAAWDPSCPVPGVLDRAQMYTTYINGGYKQAQALADRFLTKPCKGAFTFHVLGTPDKPPVIPFVVNQCYLTAMGDTPDGQTARLGWARYSEAAFVLPVWIEPADKLLALGLPPVQFFMPYVWVSLAPGMASGRESWGYRKTVADISFPVEAPPHVLNLHVSTLAQFRSLQNTEAAVEIIRGHIPAPDLGFRMGALQGPSVLRFMHDLVVGLSSAGPGIARIQKEGKERDVVLLEALAMSLKTRSVWAINLKQFRDCGQTTKACYQALVSSPITITDIEAVGSLEADKIRLELGQDVHNYDIAGDFGFEDPARLDLNLGLYADLAVKANPGHVIWSAGSWRKN